jgi:hypothetical protein
MYDVIQFVSFILCEICVTIISLYFFFRCVKINVTITVSSDDKGIEDIVEKVIQKTYDRQVSAIRRSVRGT